MMANVNADIQLSVTGNVVTQDKVDANVKTGSSLEMNIAGSTFVYDKDYEHLQNKPSIESVTLSGNKELQELGLSEISNQEITDMLSKVFED